MANDVTQDLTDAGEALGRVAPLSQLDDYEVADGYPDIRGWDVRDSAGRSIGYVYDLLADVASLRVRYVDVELDPAFAGGADRRVLIPLDRVDLEAGAEGVLLRGVEASEVHTLVPYARRGISLEREADRPAAPAAETRRTTIQPDSQLDRERHYDDDRLFAQGVGGAEKETSPAVTRTDEGRPITPDDARPADVAVRTAIETDRVQRRVAVAREDVEIERRPTLPGEDLRGADVGGDEIRIPILAEEIVVEKRLVTREVLVIRKRVITEERTVEADVRTERVEIDDPHGRVREVRPADGRDARL